MGKLVRLGIVVLVMLIVAGVGWKIINNKQNNSDASVFSVNVSSDFGGLKRVRVVNQKALDQWLTDLGYLKPEALIYDPASKSSVLVNKIDVVYTEKVQPEMQVTWSTGEVVSSARTVYDEKGEKLTLKIQVKKIDKQLDAEYLKTLEYKLLAVLYDLKYPRLPNDTTEDKMWKQIFIDSVTKPGGETLRFLGLGLGISWNLVESVSAQCNGSFQCGHNITRCNADAIDCAAGALCQDNSGNPGVCSTRCETSGGSNDCGVFSFDQFWCSMATAVCDDFPVSTNSCAIGGCSWDGPMPTPGGPGGGCSGTPGNCTGECAGGTCGTVGSGCGCIPYDNAYHVFNYVHFGNVGSTIGVCGIGCSAPAVNIPGIYFTNQTGLSWNYVTQGQQMDFQYNYNENIDIHVPPGYKLTGRFVGSDGMKVGNSSNSPCQDGTWCFGCSDDFFYHPGVRPANQIHCWSPGGQYWNIHWYVDVDCPATMNPPTNLLPSGMTLCGTHVENLTWDPSAGASENYLRVNDKVNSWLNDCSIPQNPGDVCENTGIPSTSRSVTITEGHSYDWWAQASCGGVWSNPSATANLDVPYLPSCNSGTVTCHGILVNGSTMDCDVSIGPGTQSQIDKVTYKVVGGSGVTIDPVAGSGNWNAVSGIFDFVPNSGAVVQTITLRANSTATGPVVLQAIPIAVNAVNSACTGQICGTISTGNIGVINGSNFFMTGGGGDVWAGNGSISVSMPAIVPAPKFINDGLPNIPGVVLGQNVTLGTGGVLSSKNWMATGYWSEIINQRLSNTYLQMRERVLGKLSGNPTDAGTSVYQANINAAGPTIGGVTIIKSSGSATTMENITVTGKVLWLVEGNLTINGNILLSPGSFFAVLASGDITVGNTVGYPAGTDISQSFIIPNLAGIFYAGGTFNTGVGDAGHPKIRFDGSVIGMGGVTLGRNQYVGPDPAEYFNFRPDLTVQLNSIGLRKMVWSELVNP